jgi:5'(3')-deoxyribonucleotidase
MKLDEIKKISFVGMFDFVVQLNEVFDTKIADIDWKQEGSNYVGILKINDDQFKINFEPGTFEKYNFINISFQILKDGEWSIDATLDNKSASKVIGGIVNGIQDKIRDFNFDALVFFAVSHNEKRMNIYNWVARRYLKKLGSIRENVKMKDGQYCTIVFNKDIGSKRDEFEEYLGALKKMTRPIINIDMDGVVADFDTVIKQIFGKTIWKVLTSDMWREIHKLEHFYRDLPKMPDADELWNHVHEVYSDRYDIQVLTAIPRRITLPAAEQDKRDWIAQHYGSDVIVKIGPYSRDKQKHARPGDILIDDRVDNIDMWNKVGGIGIRHTSTKDTIEQLRIIHAKP